MAHERDKERALFVQAEKLRRFLEEDGDEEKSALSTIEGCRAYLTGLSKNARRELWEDIETEVTEALLEEVGSLDSLFT
jgi:hypothetical protein